MTQEHPEEPTVPVSELRALVEEWYLRRNVHREFGYEDCANELAELVEQYE